MLQDDIVHPILKFEQYNTQASANVNILGTSLRCNFAPAKFKIQIQVATAASFYAYELDVSATASKLLFFSGLVASKLFRADLFVRRNFVYNLQLDTSAIVDDLMVVETPVET